jgi:hypothetical protein
MRIWYQGDFRLPHAQCLLLDDEGLQFLLDFLASDERESRPMDGSAVNFAGVHKLSTEEFKELDGKVNQRTKNRDQIALIGCALITFVSLTLGVTLATLIVQSFQTWPR